MEASGRRPYLEVQKRYFDQRVDFFCQPVPDSIQNRTREIVESAGLDEGSKVLDVGTGVGVLIAHFLEQNVRAENIVGCDLSEQMLKIARRRFENVFFWRGDIVDLPYPLPGEFPCHLISFDVVFFNACFGNMWDQSESLKAARRLTDNQGKIVISHPLGAGFVGSLHESEPDIVPHLLPCRKTYVDWSTRLGFSLLRFEERPGFYLAILQCNGDAE